MKTVQRGKRLRIVDKARWVKAMTALVAEVGGNQAEAARRLFLTPGHLNLLLRGKRAFLEKPTLAKLQKRASANTAAELTAALVPPGVDAHLRAYDRWLADEFLRLPRGIQAIMETIRDYAPDLVVLIGGATGRWRARGVKAKRRHLALSRTVAPLVDYDLSGKVERGPHEMRDAEVRSFIRAGLEREEILLRREADWERTVRALAEG